MDPPAGYATLEAVIEERHDLALEDFEETIGLDLVSMAQLLIPLSRRDGPAVAAVKHLCPPPVEDRAVERARQGCLLPAGAGRLHRSSRGVQPHIGPLIEHAGDGDVVVLDERDAVADDRVACEL